MRLAIRSQQVHTGPSAARWKGPQLKVPMAAIPQMAEQRANASRTADLYLGTVLPPDAVTTDSLWTAGEAVAGDKRIRERLSWMRGDLTAADAVERVFG